jgi:hypothetical protein
MVSKIAGWMVDNRIKAQVRSGDTLGVWTFDKDLPLQVIAPETSTICARQVYAFLKKQKFENKSRFEKILPEVNQVIKDSDFITVILLSSGAEAINGTPFDDRINAAYKASKKDQEKAGLPFLVLLRAQHGQITDCTVSLSPQAFELPPLPPQLLAPRVVAIKPPPAPAPVVQPLIMKGDKVMSPAGWTNEIPAAPAKP